MLNNNNRQGLSLRRNLKTTILGLGMTLFLLGGMFLFATPAAAQSNSDELTAVDIDSLLYMREEEKLAHDVYVTLYNLWGAPIFNNIANSEQAHTEAILLLLTQYGLTDPAAGNDIGVFVNQDLQALYNSLVSQGSQSYADALLVGGLIEEVDIADLQAELNVTSVTAVRQVYQSLSAGSNNHLVAFASTYENLTGTAYAAQFLSAAEVDAILANGNVSGNGNGNKGQGNGGSQGGHGGRGNQGNGNTVSANNSSQMNSQIGSSLLNGSGGNDCQNNLM
jgi:hypothetical protein